MDKEIWKDVIGYEGYYQISNLGRVKSLDRISYDKTNTNFRKTKGKILSNTLDTHGYYKVSFCRNSICKKIYVHKLLAIHFLGFNKNNSNMVIDHIDGNSLNNDLSNLQIISQGDNVRKGKKMKNSSSIHKGVCFDKHRNVWTSNININKKTIYLGRFKNEEDANLIYKKAVQKIKLYNNDNNKFRKLINYEKLI